MTTPEERLVEDLLARGINLSKLVGAIRRTLAQERDRGSDSTDGAAPSVPPSVADPTIAGLNPDGPQPIPGLSRYLDLGRLGMGGMGEVRRVFDRTLQRTLALKIIHGPALNRPQLVARFLEEAKATAQLEHPGIIPVHDLGRLPDGRLWFSMKEVSGQDLSKIIANLHRPASADRAEQWTLRRVIEVLRRVCETMAYAHGRGVLHRDLKPSNIMVGAHGEVIVIDWGIAKLLDATASSSPLQSGDPKLLRQTGEQEALTREGHVPGTPAYMSPEHASGSSELDARSDVYALGAILYKILSGRSPYRGSALSILEQVIEAPPSRSHHSRASQRLWFDRSTTRLTLLHGPYLRVSRYHRPWSQPVSERWRAILPNASPTHSRWRALSKNGSMAPSDAAMPWRWSRAPPCAWPRPMTCG